jgi:hypothetical protein
MKGGLEYHQILYAIMLIAVVVGVVIVVLYPFINFRQTTTDKQDFEDFCVFWSLQGYNTQLQSIQANGVTYTIADKCKIAMKTTSPDIPSCVKCCRKEIIC